MYTFLGIDEAGRGPVIGPMVIAGVLISEDKLDRLARLGVQDSKTLSRRQREQLAPQIEVLADAVKTIIVTPTEIDRINLNQLEAEGMASLINALAPDRVYLDLPVAPGGSCNYLKSLRYLLSDAEGEAKRALPQIIGENKADSRYAVVAAASIIAKVSRDRLVSELKAAYGDFGWGYPGEPKTRAFLKRWYEEHGAWPDFVRTKWKTVQQIAAMGKDGPADHPTSRSAEEKLL